jgi:hypothetical protein
MKKPSFVAFSKVLRSGNRVVGPLRRAPRRKGFFSPLLPYHLRVGRRDVLYYVQRPTTADEERSLRAFARRVTRGWKS